MYNRLLCHGCMLCTNANDFSGPLIHLGRAESYRANAYQVDHLLHTYMYLVYLRVAPDTFTRRRLGT